MRVLYDPAICAFSMQPFSMMKPKKDRKTLALPSIPSPSDACLIVIASQYDFEWEQIGDKFPLKQSGSYIGNETTCDIILAGGDGASVVRKALFYYDHDEQTWMIQNCVDQRETRLYVNGLVTWLTRISEGDMIQLGKKGALFRLLQGENIQSNIYDVLKNRIEKEKKRADTDVLTKIPNRRALEQELEEHILHCSLYDRNLSAIFVDVDRFHDINTQFTHLGGDKVLSELATRIQEHIRPLDTFARFGGEELVVLLRGEDYEHALVFAERLRTLIAEKPFVYRGQNIVVTASFGVATLQPEWNGEQLLLVASTCTHLAKERGRNRVAGYKELTAIPSPPDTAKPKKKTKSTKRDVDHA